MTEEEKFKILMFITLFIGLIGLYFAYFKDLRLLFHDLTAYYKAYLTVDEKLQDTLEMIEESLDVALSKTCNGFDEKHYEKVQIAYRLLGKTQVSLLYVI